MNWSLELDEMRDRVLKSALAKLAEHDKERPISFFRRSVAQRERRRIEKQKRMDLIVTPTEGAGAHPSSSD